MTNPDLNLQMLTKLLRMTESSHDGEALNAIRMANSMLNKHNANWDEVLRGLVPMVDADPFAKAPDLSSKPGKIQFTNAAEIDGYFAKLQRRNLGSFKTYVDSVHEWWTQKKFLTEKQYNVIKNAAQR